VCNGRKVTLGNAMSRECLVMVKSTSLWIRDRCDNDRIWEIRDFWSILLMYILKSTGGRKEEYGEAGPS
jgi:hypothetical protein